MFGISRDAAGMPAFIVFWRELGGDELDRLLLPLSLAYASSSKGAVTGRPGESPILFPKLVPSPAECDTGKETAELDGARM